MGQSIFLPKNEDWFTKAKGHHPGGVSQDKRQNKDSDLKTIGLPNSQIFKKILRLLSASSHDEVAYIRLRTTINSVQKN